MQTPSPKDAGLSCIYDLAVPMGETEMASHAMGAYGIRHAATPGADPDARDILAFLAVAPGAPAPSDAELVGMLAELSARHPRARFELVLAVSREGMPGRVWRRVADGIACVETDFHVKRTMPGGGLFGHDPRTLAAVFAGIRTRRGPSGAGREDGGPVLGSDSAACGWHRKGNLRLFGSVRMLRFKVRKGAAGSAPLHRRESPLWSLRLGRTAWIAVRQDGPLEFDQVPDASGANTLALARRALQRALHPVALFFWGLAVRRRRYSHFLMLGYNCELAFRFLKANGFLDSTFFAWAGCWAPDIMLGALDRFDDVCRGDLAFAGATDIFIDVSTGVMAHARLKVETGAPSGEADAEAARAEIRSRMAHLREKFYRQLRDGEPTLAAVKISPSERQVADEFARGIVGRLRAMGGRNFRLLVVCQKADAGFFPKEHPDYDLRTVSEFNPDWRAATDLAGDRLGWMKIWREFAPARRIVQSKTYKFDGRGG